MRGIVNNENVGAKEGVIT